MVFKKFFKLKLLAGVNFVVIHAFTLSEVYVKDYTPVYFHGTTLGILILTEEVVVYAFDVTGIEDC